MSKLEPPSPSKPNRAEGKNGGPDSAVSQLARVSGHGLTLAVSTVLFLFGGLWVDGRLGTTPLFTIVGALTGALGGILSLLRHMLPKSDEGESSKKDSESRGS